MTLSEYNKEAQVQDVRVILRYSSFMRLRSTVIEIEYQRDNSAKWIRTNERAEECSPRALYTTANQTQQDIQIDVRFPLTYDFIFLSSITLGVEIYTHTPILHSIGIVQKRLVFFFDINGFDCFLIRINLFNKETDERDNTVLTKKKNWNSRIHLLTSI